MALQVKHNIYMFYIILDSMIVLWVSGDQLPRFKLLKMRMTWMKETATDHSPDRFYYNVFYFIKALLSNIQSWNSAQYRIHNCPSALVLLMLPIFTSIWSLGRQWHGQHSEGGATNDSLENYGWCQRSIVIYSQWSLTENIKQNWFFQAIKTTRVYIHYLKPIVISSACGKLCLRWIASPYKKYYNKPNPESCDKCSRVVLMPFTQKLTIW